MGLWCKEYGFYVMPVNKPINSRRIASHFLDWEIYSIAFSWCAVCGNRFMCSECGVIQIRGSGAGLAMDKKPRLDLNILRGHWIGTFKKCNH